MGGPTHEDSLAAVGGFRKDTGRPAFSGRGVTRFGPQKAYAVGFARGGLGLSR
jgi:hypothetical protein